ncbi:hypothetical protein AURDEDRAFT_154078 [Auricularia subglabra TFB-10046 SS5]|nr:hypothetical protein AURDEDRAFT_154078 [Auricularia subglabra TFB-10046 SS5]
MHKQINVAFHPQPSKIDQWQHQPPHLLRALDLNRPRDKRQCNISALPIEMLSRCFSFLPMQLFARLPVLHVSRGWRAAAFAFPDVWSHIQLSDSTPKGHLLVDLVLSHTKAYPFDFYHASYDFRASTADISGMLAKHMYRMRSIHWSFGGPSDFPWSSPAPLLEHISGQALDLIPSDFLGAVPGRLRSLEIRALCLPESCPALSTLTRLKAWVHLDEEDSRFLCRLFDFCPRLEELTLDLHLRDASLLPRGPAPASLMRLRLATSDSDVDSTIDRLDLVALCSTWQVIPRIPYLELASFRFADADLALACDDAVELSIDYYASDNRAVRIIGHFSGEREYILQSYSRLDSLAAPIAQCLVAYQKQGLLHALRRLTISSQISHLFAKEAGTLAVLAELTIIFYPVMTPTQSDSSRDTFTFPWARLSLLPLAPILETLCVDIQHRAEGAFGFTKHVPTDADALALAPVVRDALKPFEQQVRVVVKGFTEEAVSTVDRLSWGDRSVTFLCARGSPSLL